jgi:hypothetical protein
MRIHTTHSRDAALRDLHRLNRWMVAGSVVLTGVLSDVAANAFPGKAIKAKGTAEKTVPGAHVGSHKSSSSHTTTGVLKPPAQAPKASTEAAKTSTSEGAPANESTPSQESAPTQESAPAQEATPTHESAPAQESVPTHESAPAQETTPAPAPEAAPEPEASAPVVSGGS